MNFIIKTILILVLTILLIAPPLLYYSFKLSPVSWQLVPAMNHESGLMLKGYDPVSYFNEGKAIKGNPNNGLKWDDTIWYFSSDVNKLTFKTFPEKYSPQYGGYCAGAIASGLTFESNPLAWHIENNRLFLFFNEDAKDKFIANINNGIIEKADAEWQQR